VFDAFRDELEAHAIKEETILFPLIKCLEAAEMLPSFHCGSIQNPIRRMMQEHDDAGEALAKMRALTGDYTPPPGACNTFCVLLDSLKELEADMHLHVHKENNILFPRALAQETALAAKEGTRHSA
jgi:regulator of cell morphogenesis and NO signaling